MGRPPKISSPKNIKNKNVSISKKNIKPTNIFEKKSKRSGEEEKQITFSGKPLSGAAGTGKKLSKNDLLKQPGVLLKIFESTPDSMIIFDSEGKITNVNTPCLQMLGYKNINELKRKNILDLIIKKDRLKLYKENKFILDKESPCNIECTIIKKDRQRIFGEISSSLLRDNKNNPVYYAVIIKDVSYRTESEKEIKRLIGFYENILNSIYNGVCVTDRDDMVIYVNKFTEEVTRYAGIEVLNQSLDDLLKHPSFKNLEQYCTSAKLTLTTVSFDSLPLEISKEKTIFHSGWFIPRVLNKNYCGMIFVSHDVTSHKKSEDALVNERNLLSELIENIPFFVYIKDKYGKFLLCNRSLADFLKTTPQEMVGKDDFAYMPAKSAEKYHIEEQNIMETGIPVFDKVSIFSNRRCLRGYSSYTKVPYFDKEKNVIGLIGLNRDITASKRITEDLEILLNISNGLQHAKSYNDIGRNIFDTLSEYGYINYFFGMLMIYDPRKNLFNTAFSRENPKDRVVLSDEAEPKDIRILINIAVQNKKTLLIGDNHSEISLKLDPSQSNTVQKSMVFIPLYNEEILIGLLYFASYPENSVDDNSANLLESIAKYTIISISNLISKRKSEESEKLLFENEQRYSIAMQATKDVIYDCDLKNRKLFLSNAACELFGIDTVDEFTYHNWEQFTHPDDQAMLVATLLECLKNRKDISFQYRILSKDGKIKYNMVKGTVVYGPDGEPERIVGALADITQLKESEEALRKSQKIMRQLAKHTVQLQEEERKRIVRELHDGINQVIASVKFKIEMAKEKIESSENNILLPINEAIISLEETISEIRNICQNLRPNILDDFGLIPAVKRFCQEFTQKTKIVIQTDFDDLENRLPPEIEINIYRIFQEALNNIEKHSKATLVNCFIQFFDNEVSIEIKDNGVGFEPAVSTEPFSRREHYGLMNMRERVDFIGGDFAITSVRKKGTDIQIKIPLEYNSF